MSCQISSTVALVLSTMITRSRDPIMDVHDNPVPGVLLTAGEIKVGVEHVEVLS